MSSISRFSENFQYYTSTLKQNIPSVAALLNPQWVGTWAITQMQSTVTLLKYNISLLQPSQLQISIPFLEWLTKTENSHDEYVHFDPQLLGDNERGLIHQNLRLIADPYDEETVKRLYDHLSKAAGKRKMILASPPTLDPTPFTYKFPTNLIVDELKNVSFSIPKDVEHRFNGLIYHFENQKIKSLFENKNETKKHIQQFCETFHLKLLEKASKNPDLQKCINKNIASIFFHLFRYACLDGLGSYVYGENVKQIALSEDLTSNFESLFTLDQDKTIINFELDEGNLMITFTMMTIATFTRIAKSNNPVERASEFHSCASIRVVLDLLDGTFLKKEHLQGEMITLPYMPFSEPKTEATSESKSRE